MRHNIPQTGRQAKGNVDSGMPFNTPGYWVANRVFPARLGKAIGVGGWMGLAIDFVLCFAVIWVLYRPSLRVINEVER